jgi:hypothetical protein
MFDRHGDMIFINIAYQSYDDYDAALAQQAQPPTSTSSPDISSSSVGKIESKRVWETVQEDVRVQSIWRSDCQQGHTQPGLATG